MEPTQNMVSKFGISGWTRGGSYGLLENPSPVLSKCVCFSFNDAICYTIDINAYSGLKFSKSRY